MHACVCVLCCIRDKPLFLDIDSMSILLKISSKQMLPSYSQDHTSAADKHLLRSHAQIAQNTFIWQTTVWRLEKT